MTYQKIQLVAVDMKMPKEVVMGLSSIESLITYVEVGAHLINYLSFLQEKRSQDHFVIQKLQRALESRTSQRANHHRVKFIIPRLMVATSDGLVHSSLTTVINQFIIEMQQAALGYSSC